MDGSQSNQPQREAQVSTSVAALTREGNLLDDVFSNLEQILEDRLSSILQCQTSQEIMKKGEALDSQQPVGLSCQIDDRTATIIRVRERMERFTEDFLRRIEL